jgi:nucleoside-diphosphate-sugar epimerase
MDRIDLHEQSITDPAACAAACVGIDYVLHQAALPSVSRSVSNPIATHDVSATGTLNMLVAANDAGVRRLVYAGSSSAYGDTPTLPKH